MNKLFVNILQPKPIDDKKKHTCKICRVIITDNDEMLKHKELHGKMRKEQCVLCTKQFTTRSALQYHAQHAHKVNLKKSVSE